MAKYKVTYACGHETDVQLYGKESERERKIKWYGTQLCPECEAREAAEIAAQRGYPTLAGSEKQVAWAIKIRNKAVDFFSSLIAKAPEQHRELLTGLRDQWVGKETEAKYWIDNRDELEYVSDIQRLVAESTGFGKK